ncbi:hypothetical protein HOR19_gp28 [Phage MedPE-SWcel-C56]|uniref:Uncharacterized protein n=1 Tax=Phage MedPE-SWcel-C56 TaxID=1871314 RepID=A0A1B1IY19_9CAUD|nr:hypothetical protein HOR19_gp28 [Phage MedPE-SWcel-C56]ANS06221.1 hypothetical protein [Phage MedPE-SWcel-C56]
MNNDKLLGQVNKSVEKGTVQDQTEDKGGFERELTPVGKYPARFVGYVEVGKRDGNMYNGKKKAPSQKAYAYFELVSKKLAQEIEVDGVKKTIYPVHREMLDVKQGDKANLTKLFKQMAAGRANLTHIAQMLGEPFFVEIVHQDKGEGDSKKTYENARDKDRGWLITPPIKDDVDGDGEVTQVKVRMKEQTVPIKLLLWGDPTPEQWDSIKGHPYEYKDGEVEKTCEGGYLQHICMTQAIDFEGSALQAMLAGGALGDVLDDEVDAEPEDEVDAEPDELGDAEAEDLGDPLDDLDDEIPY